MPEQRPNHPKSLRQAFRSLKNSLRGELQNSIDDPKKAPLTNAAIDLLKDKPRKQVTLRPLEKPISAHQVTRSVKKDVRQKLEQSISDPNLAFLTKGAINLLAEKRPERAVKNLREIGIQSPSARVDIAHSLTPEDERYLQQVAKAQVKFRSKVTLRDETPPATQQVRLNEAISLQSNEIAKNNFVTAVREHMGPPYVDAHGRANEVWFNNQDLKKLANEYHVPFVALEIGRHWHLLLEIPKFSIDPVVGSTYGVRAYNPMVSGEVPLQLAWTQDAKENWQKQYLGDAIPASQEAIELVKKGKYNLKFGKEPLNLRDIKGARKQFDGWNCGPICFFEAVLLAALSDSTEPEFEKFRKEGLPKFKRDFLINVLTRDEILLPSRVKISPQKK